MVSTTVGGQRKPSLTSGELAHQVEHLLCKQKVKGSSPLLSTNEVINCFGQVSNVEIRLIKPETLRLISGELEVKT